VKQKSPQKTYINYVKQIIDFEQKRRKRKSTYKKTGTVGGE